MSGLEHIRAVVSLLENREAVDVSLFGEDAGETLETKATLANARKVLDWFEGLINSQNPYAERIIDTGKLAEKARQAFDKTARAVSTELL